MRWHSLTINRLGDRPVELLDSLERAVPRRRHPEPAANGAERRAYSIVYNTDAEGADEDAELPVEAQLSRQRAPTDHAPAIRQPIPTHRDVVP